MDVYTKRLQDYFIVTKEGSQFSDEFIEKQFENWAHKPKLLVRNNPNQSFITVETIRSTKPILFFPREWIGYGNIVGEKTGIDDVKMVHDTRDKADVYTLESAIELAETLLKQPLSFGDSPVAALPHARRIELLDVSAGIDRIIGYFVDDSEREQTDSPEIDEDVMNEAHRLIKTLKIANDVEKAGLVIILAGSSSLENAEDFVEFFKSPINVGSPAGFSPPRPSPEEDELEEGEIIDVNENEGENDHQSPNYYHENLMAGEKDTITHQNSTFDSAKTFDLSSMQSGLSSTSTLQPNAGEKRNDPIVITPSRAKNSPTKSSPSNENYSSPLKTENPKELSEKNVKTSPKRPVVRALPRHLLFGDNPADENVVADNNEAENSSRYFTPPKEIPTVQAPIRQNSPASSTTTGQSWETAPTSSGFKNENSGEKQAENNEKDEKAPKNSPPPKVCPPKYKKDKVVKGKPDGPLVLALFSPNKWTMGDALGAAIIAQAYSGSGKRNRPVVIMSLDAVKDKQFDFLVGGPSVFHFETRRYLFTDANSFSMHLLGFLPRDYEDYRLATAGLCWAMEGKWAVYNLVLRFASEIFGADSGGLFDENGQLPENVEKMINAYFRLIHPMDEFVQGNTIPTQECQMLRKMLEMGMPEPKDSIGEGLARFRTCVHIAGQYLCHFVQHQVRLEFDRGYRIQVQKDMQTDSPGKKS